MRKSGTERLLSCGGAAAAAAAGTALCTLLLSTQISGSSACTFMSDKSPFQDFSSPSRVLASGTVPLPGQCFSWTLQLKTLPNCSQANSSMLLEMWLEDRQGAPFPPGMNIYGLSLTATKSSDPTSSGGYSYVDAAALDSHATTQRFVVPVASNQQWSLSLQNTVAQPLSDMHYAIRATCMAPLTKLPCPRPSRSLPPCNWAGVQCVTDPLSPGSERCACGPGSIGPSCNIPLTDLSSTGKDWLPVYVPGQSWVYFNVTLPASRPHSSATALLLVELQKTAGSMSTSQPVLHLLRQPSTSTGTSTGTAPSLPERTDIDPVKFKTQDDCLCDNCSCYIPYQAESLAYEFDQGVISGDSNTTTAWVVGIWNNAPYLSGSNSGALQIRARYNTSDSPQLPGPLCPLDCSGQGSCMRLNTWNSSVGRFFYDCECNAGYGGPYCQGQLRMLPPLSSSNSFSLDFISIQPGEMDVFLLTLDPNSVMSGADTLMVTWSLLPSSLQAFLLLTPRVASLNMGLQYFIPRAVYILNATSGTPYPIPVLQESYIFSWWYIAIYNSNRTTVAAGNYSLGLQLPGEADSQHLDSLINKLQLGIIGAVAALIILLLTFMTVRVLLLRRHLARRSLVVDLSLTSLTGLNTQQQQRQVRRGVPPAVADKFPTFTYSKEDFAQQRLALQAAAPGAAAAPPPPPAARPRRTPPPPPPPAAADDAVELGLDAPQCSVCICSYEEGEVLRQLPCRHIFHKSCIDPWLTTHVTCPNCRTPLAPSTLLLQEEQGAEGGALPHPPAPRVAGGAGR